MAKKPENQSYPYPTSIEDLFAAACGTKFTWMFYQKGDQKYHRLLAEIYVWQEISNYADRALKQAWATAQAEVLPTDDVLRERPLGENKEAEVLNLSVVATISQGRQVFDQAQFVSLVASRYDIPAGKLGELVDRSKRSSANSLSKRVVLDKEQYVPPVNKKKR